jgi:hypothetical protein
MQVSIWSAFSSNHSSRFTVVGIFQTPEQAEQAAGVFMNLLQSVVDWYNLPENADARDELEGSEPEPTPPERALAKQLAIYWGPLSLDWLWVGINDHEPVKVLDNLVFLDGTESESGAYPADAVIERLGGQAFVNGDKDDEGREITSVELNLTCVAPDEAAAEAIEIATSDPFRTPVKTQDPGSQSPWIAFAGRPDVSIQAGKMRRTGRVLAFNCQFSQIAFDFPDMLAYLRDRGCVDFQYQFTEKNFFEEE